MKKFFLPLILLIGCLLITGCGEAKEAKQETESKVYSFTDNGNEFVLGAIFDEDKLGQNSSYSETVSCASQGTDKTYTYPNFEVKTYNDGKDDRILSIYLITDDVQTKEGVKVTDSYQKMLDTYGNNFDQLDALYIYRLGKTALHFMVENDVITAIEYVYDADL